jgi:class 3 adenylate cyclase
MMGDLIGQGASPEQVVFGDTPNLAARLQGIAEPNGRYCREHAAASFEGLEPPRGPGLKPRY